MFISKQRKLVLAEVRQFAETFSDAALDVSRWLSLVVKAEQPLEAYTDFDFCHSDIHLQCAQQNYVLFWLKDVGSI